MLYALYKLWTYIEFMEIHSQYSENEDNLQNYDNLQNEDNLKVKAT